MKRRLLVLFACPVLATCGGGNGDPGRIAFDVSFTNLPDLGRGQGHYEGFAVLAGEPRSTGKFIVNSAFTPPLVTSPDGVRVYGDVQGATFGPAATGVGQAFPFIQEATDFFVSIEPESDTDSVPSGNTVMVGAFVGGSAVLGPVGTTATGGPGIGNFAAAAGSAVLVNPTGLTDSDQNGVWFATDATGAVPSLALPAPTGTWTYEAFVSDGTQTFPVGRFRDPAAPDDDAQATPLRGGSGIGFRAPGQDFINAAVFGAAQPRILVGGTWRVEITVEPVQDNAPGPFPLRILEAMIPQDAVSVAGVVAREVPLASLAAALPAIATQAGPGSLSGSGSGLGPLGGVRAGAYACWSVIGGAPALVARFVVDAGGQVTSPDGVTVFGTLAAFVFDPVNTGLGAAFPPVGLGTEVFITQEAQASSSATPAPVVVVAGAQDAGGSASLTVAGSPGGSGLADFSGVSGVFVCQSPTNDSPSGSIDDGAGVWFRLLGSGGPSLVLPALPAAWVYEGWVVETVTGERWSTGRFRGADGADEDAMTWRGRGPLNTGFDLPGQDFVMVFAGGFVPAAPDLRTGWTITVTLEPVPDTSPSPSPFVILTGPLPSTTLVSSFPLANVSGSLPTGLASF